MKKIMFLASLVSSLLFAIEGYACVGVVFGDPLADAKGAVNFRVTNDGQAKSRGANITSRTLFALNDSLAPGVVNCAAQGSYEVCEFGVDPAKSTTLDITYAGKLSGLSANFSGSGNAKWTLTGTGATVSTITNFVTHGLVSVSNPVGYDCQIGSGEFTSACSQLSGNAKAALECACNTACGL